MSGAFQTGAGARVFMEVQASCLVKRRRDACAPSALPVRSVSTARSMGFRTAFATVIYKIWYQRTQAGTSPPRRGTPLAAHGNAMGMFRFKSKSPVGAPHDDAPIGMDWVC